MSETLNCSSPSGPEESEIQANAQVRVDVEDIVRILRDKPRHAAGELARYVLQEHHILNYPIPITSIAHSEKVQIETTTLPFADGALIPSADGKGYTICISDLASAHRWRFAVAHELGHFMLRRMQSTTRLPNTLVLNLSKGVEELFCNWFAAALLIPDSAITDFPTWETLTIGRMAERAMALDVSISAFARRILERLPHKDAGYKDTGAMQFRYSPLKEDANASPFLLADAIFYRLEGMRKHVGMRIPHITVLHDVLARTYDRTYRYGVTTESLYEAIPLGFTSLSGQYTILVKPLGGTIWVLVLPQHVDLNLIKQMCKEAAKPEYTQIALFP